MRAPRLLGGEEQSGQVGDEVVAWPVAKVNLHLSVGALRDDGFHEIVTLFQAVDLADRLVVAPAGEGIELEVDGVDVGPPGDNLCVRAARAFRAATGWGRGVRMRLLKGIPAGAGLGGGSSDAAAVLLVLNDLAGRPLPDEGLRELGASLGSDVPFLLGRSALALGRGRGERLDPLEPLPPAALVLVVPPVHVDTGAAYRALEQARHDRAERPSLGARPEGPPRSWAEIAELARNDFQEVVPGRHPEVAAALAELRRVGATPALLCGSGGAVWGGFETWTAALEGARGIESALGFPAVAVRTLRTFDEVAGPNRRVRSG